MKYVVLTCAGSETNFKFNTIREAKKCVELKNTRYDLVKRADYQNNLLAELYPNMFKKVVLKSLHQY